MAMAAPPILLVDDDRDTYASLSDVISAAVPWRSGLTNI